MERITEAQLQAVVDRINRETGSPMASYTSRADGHYASDVGNYHLDGAYSGWRLVRMANAGGGITSITHSYVSKRELYDLMQAILTGIEIARQLYGIKEAA